MWKKILIPSLSIALLLVISVPISSVNAGGKWWKRNINWRIAGTIVQLLDITSPVPGEGYVGPHSLINLTARGAPGSAKITLLSRLTFTPPPTLEPFVCADGYIGPVAYFDKNDMVAVFFDQSLLFASIDETQGGILCVGISGTETEGTTYFKVQNNVTGGKGRFERASGGVFIGEGNGYPVSLDSTLAGENGRIKGTIDFD